MNRRRFLAVGTGAFLSLNSGCITDPGARGGVIEVMAADPPPNATVTDVSDDRLGDGPPIRRGLRQAHEGNGVAAVEVTEKEYDAVAGTLSALPWYDRLNHDSNYISGIYLTYENEVYVVVLTPFCTDSWFKDAQSKRGDYGWGGCIDREEWKT